jgi:hypothetical protein
MGRSKRGRSSVDADELQRRGVAMCWFDAGQWEALRDAAEDADELPESYESYVADIEHVRDQLRGEGLLPIEIPVDISELVRWCELCTYPNDAKHRSLYAAQRLQQMVENRDPALGEALGDHR